MLTLEFRFSVKLSFERLLDDRKVPSDFARRLEDMVVFLLSQRQFRFCGVIKYRHQERRTTHRVYGRFNSARICDVGDQEVILSKTQSYLQLFRVTDNPELVASAFQRRLEFWICDQLSTVRTRMLVG